MDLRLVLLTVFSSCLVFCGADHALGQQQGVVRQEREAWVMEALQQMETIKPGMTRAQLLKVFTIQGGFFIRQSHTYRYRGCLLFAVDVEFRPVVKPEQSIGTDAELANDVVVNISRPYLARMVRD